MLSRFATRTGVVLFCYKSCGEVFIDEGFSIVVFCWDLLFLCVFCCYRVSRVVFGLLC